MPTSKWGFIDPSGRYVIKPQFDEVGYFQEGFAKWSFGFKEGCSRKVANKWGYIDKTGVYVLATYELITTDDTDYIQI